MDPLTKLHYTHITQSLSPIKSPPTPRLHSSHTSFPIIAVAIIGILATAFLLVSYYIFVIKCCLNWHRIDLLRRFSFSRNRHRHEGSLVTFSPPLENRGLEESVIRSIPILNYQELAERNQLECSVCLNEFQKEEKLRIIPNCNHFFHIDCIDVWLQSNSNCPLCRRSISIESTQFPLPNQDISASPCNDDEDYVVIELGDEQNQGHHSGDVLVQPREISPSPTKVEQNTVVKKGKRFSHVVSMGDECIDIRGKDERFSVQPLRRSFSMNSADDRQLYLAVQEIVQGKNRPLNEVSSSEDFSSRMKRSFFPFGHGRGSRNAVLPIHLDP